VFCPTERHRPGKAAVVHPTLFDLGDLRIEPLPAQPQHRLLEQHIMALFTDCRQITYYLVCENLIY
jgi:hypothetical protein